MNSRDYLEALGAALRDRVPVREKMDIMRYYKEYFEEAGPEREQEIMEELGDPRQLAERIIREGGYLSEAGEPKERHRGNRRRLWPYVLAGAAALCLLIVPVSRLRLNRTTKTQVDMGSATSKNVNGDVMAAAETAIDAFTRVDLEVELGNVTLRTGEGYGLSLTGFEEDGYQPQFSVQNGKLKVWSDSASVSGLALTDVTAEVIVTVPAGATLSELEIKTGMGNLFFEDVTAGDLDGETGMGSIFTRNVDARAELSLDAGMGDITLTGPLAPDTELDTGMGAVTVEAACGAAQCRYELESGMGAITVDGQQQSGSEVKGGSKNAPYELEITAGMGDITVNFGA